MRPTFNYASPSARTAQMVSVYFKGQIRNEHSIHRVRDELYSRPGIPTHSYEKSTAHITILPRFTISQQQMPNCEEQIQQFCTFVSPTIHINGAGVWPSLQLPYVVLLDANTGFTEEQTNLYQYLSELGASFTYPPTKPHITLFKSHSDNPPFLTSVGQKQLQNGICSHRDSWETTLTNLSVEIEAL